AVRRERALDELLGIGAALEIDRPAIDQERQARIVGNRAVVGEGVALGLDHELGGHRSGLGLYSGACSCRRTGFHFAGTCAAPAPNGAASCASTMRPALMRT